MIKTNMVNHVKQENLIVHHNSQIQVVKRAFFVLVISLISREKGIA
jgi:hypothetical protein